MEFNRVYLIGKGYLESMSDKLIDIEFLAKEENERSINILDNINKKGKYYNISSKLDCNESVFRKFYELFRNEQIPFHESLFIFDLSKDYKKEYFIKEINGFATYDLKKQKFLEYSHLNTLKYINNLVFNSEYYENEYFRTIVYFLSFLKTNKINFMVTDCDNKVNDYISDIDYVSVNSRKNLKRKYI